MANEVKKTLKELSILNKGTSEIGEIINGVNKNNLSTLEQTLKIIQTLNDKDVARLDILKEISGEIESQEKDFKEMGSKDSDRYLKALKLIKKTQEDITKQQKAQANQQKALSKLAAETGKAFDHILQQNKAIFETSHNMQLENNVTWRQFTAMYDEAYNAARRLNEETGKQLFNAREIIELQNTLGQRGWKGLDASTMANVTASMSMLHRTLGSLDERLIQAFEVSYRQFGAQTDTFITGMGNRLNAFSNSFGLTVGALQGTVATMITQNTFIARNNMSAQLKASESLMQAAALSSSIGLTSHDFIKQLSTTAQFGTASQMADLYTAGAYLTGFDTNQFQQQLQGQDYMGAIQGLFSSISNTVGGMESGYLKNEYMQQISSGFGLSMEDIMNIVQNGGQLGEYSKEIQDKLLEANNSMEEEISDLHMSLIEQVKNFWGNSGASQFIGKVMNEAGLYGIEGHLKGIASLIALSAGKDSLLGFGANSGKNALINLFSGSGKAAGATSLSNGMIVPIGGTSAMSGLSKGLRLGGGALIGVGANVVGHNMVANNTSNNLGTNIGGHALNFLGGVGGGALAGSAFGGVPGAIVGGIIGGVSGIINSISAAGKQKDAIQALDDERRRSASSMIVSTGDPLVDAINAQTAVLVDTLNGTADKTTKMQLVIDMADKTSTR